MRNGGLAGSRRLGWLIAGVLSVVTAGWGLLDPGIYVGLIAPATRPGALSQDVITVIAGLTLCGLAGTRIGPKAELVGLGLLGYLFYGYGIYVIERVYNLLYLNYLALFGIAAWLLVLGAVVPCTSGQAARADILVSRAVVEGPGVGQVEAVPLF